MRIPDDVDVTFLTADCLLLSWGGARLGRVERPLGVPTWRAYASGGRRLDPDDGLPHHHLVELVLDAGGYIRSTT